MHLSLLLLCVSAWQPLAAAEALTDSTSSPAQVVARADPKYNGDSSSKKPHSHGHTSQRNTLIKEAVPEELALNQLQDPQYQGPIPIDPQLVGQGAGPYAQPGRRRKGAPLNNPYGPGAPFPLRKKRLHVIPSIAKALGNAYQQRPRKSGQSQSRGPGGPVGPGSPWFSVPGNGASAPQGWDSQQQGGQGDQGYDSQQGGDQGYDQQGDDGYDSQGEYQGAPQQQSPAAYNPPAAQAPQGPQVPPPIDPADPQGRPNTVPVAPVKQPGRGPFRGPTRGPGRGPLRGPSRGPTRNPPPSKASPDWPAGPKNWPPSAPGSPQGHVNQPPPRDPPIPKTTIIPRVPYDVPSNPPPPPKKQRPAGLPPLSQFTADCEALTQLRYPNVTIQSAEFVKAKTRLRFPGVAASCFRTYLVGANNAVDVCRVKIQFTTSPTTKTNMEVWLPRDWKGRLAATGNGGINGCIKFTDMSYGSELGFVTVGSDNGHNGNTAKYFLNDPESLEDYGWRSYYYTSIIGKRIAYEFYGEAVKYSYAYGCSTGGREVVNAAQMYPWVFDGYAGGAHTSNWPDLNSWSNHFLNITGNFKSPEFLMPQTWMKVHAEAIRQCDMNDGVKDNVIENPHLCKWDPSKIACEPGKVSPKCLTPTQIKTVKSIYEPFIGIDGKEIYSHMNPGNEGGRSFIYFDGYPNSYAQDWYRYAVFNDPLWSSRKMTLRDAKYSHDFNPGGTASWRGDLSLMEKTGKKMITWHGLEDSIIMPDNSNKYYRHVQATMNRTHDQMDYFFRHFRIAGMDHCADGGGASEIGQFSSPKEVQYDPDKNPLLAIVRWVEQDIAPDTILGSKYTSNRKEVLFQRKHCRYPYQNTFSGKGDPTEADSWYCKLPPNAF